MWTCRFIGKIDRRYYKGKIIKLIPDVWFNVMEPKVKNYRYKLSHNEYFFGTVYTFGLNSLLCILLTFIKI